MAKKNNDVQEIPPTFAAPVFQEPQVTVERQGASRVPSSARYPRVIGGTCEHCGVLNKGYPAEMQYTLCPHYRNVGQLRCSYCDDLQDPAAVIGHNTLNVAAHPENPSKLIVWCGSFKCSEAHTKRFDPSKK